VFLFFRAFVKKVFNHMNTTHKNISVMRREAVDIFYAGLQAADPIASIKRTCRLSGTILSISDKPYDLADYRHIYVIGAGKASAAMASAMEDILGTRITRGIINVKYDHVTNLETIELKEAGHPVPDEKGLRGAAAIIDLAETAESNDLVICLISGGGSALLPSPAEGVTLADKQETIRCLLSCGATIHEINTIRKHTSRIKGGRLARACYPATVVSLILSDVVGDDFDIIASGPTVADPGSFQDCMDIVTKYELKSVLPNPVMRHLQSGLDGKIEETPKPDDIAFKNVQNIIIGNNVQTLVASAKHAEQLGYNTLILSSLFEGETRNVAFFHAAIIKEIIKSNHPVAAPACILSGGETTVTLSGNGLGGRNQEFALASVLYLEGLENFVLLSAGTDGTDGPTDAAGAIIDAQTLDRCRSNQLEVKDYLKRNDSYHFFKRLGDLLITGPTQTNVMDLRIILVV
jgi:glycerate 2-kinase